MKSLEDLQALRDKELARLGVRQGQDLEGKPKIIVGMGTCGIEAGARDVLAALVEAVAEQNLAREVIVEQMAAPDLCSHAPVVKVVDIEGKITIYSDMTIEKALEVLEQHVVNGEIIVEYTKD